MSQIIQITKLVVILSMLQFRVLGQHRLNQFNFDLISKYVYEEFEIKTILNSPELFILNVQNANKKTVISEIPRFLSSFRVDRVEKISILNNKIFDDTINYHFEDTEGFVVVKCLFDKKNILLFRYEAYIDGSEFYTWYNEFGHKIVGISKHGLNYEEKTFVDEICIKKIVISDNLGYVEFYDLECRLILSIDYLNGKIDKGTFINHKQKEYTTLVW